MPKKMTGKLIGKVLGLEIYAESIPAKTVKGKDQLWISVRQSAPKTWRIHESLCYVNGFDVQFKK